MNDLTRVVKTLQGKGEVGEIFVRKQSIGCKTQEPPSDLGGFLILPLCGEHYAQPVIRSKFPRVALNLLLKRLGRLVQFPGYNLIVVGGYLNFSHSLTCSRNWNALAKYTLARSTWPRVK